MGAISRQLPIDAVFNSPFAQKLRNRLAARLRVSEPPSHGPNPMFSGRYASWQEAASQCQGYDASIIFQKTCQATLAVHWGEAAFERDSVLFHKPEYRWEVLAALLWQASRDEGRMRVMDFGGALGSVYYQSRAFLRDLPEVKWGVVEQAHYIDFGNRELAGEALKFFPAMRDCLSAITPNVLLFGGVLQYLEKPFDLLGEALAYGLPAIVFDKMALALSEEDHLVIQRVPPSIYDASYPAWFLSESRLKAFMATAGYILHSEWKNVDNYPLEDVRTVFKGFLFVRNDSTSGSPHVL